MNKHTFEFLINKIKKIKCHDLILSEEGRGKCSLLKAQLEELISAAEKNASINHLVIRNDDLLTDILANLHRIIQNKFILKIDLSFNSIREKDIKYIANIIENHPSLYYLYLANTSLTDNGLAMLAKALEKNQSLIVLNLVGNNQISDAGAKHLIEASKINQSLISIELNLTSISENKTKLIDEYTRYNRWRYDGAQLLFPMPLIAPQKGPACGFYAVAAAAQYFVSTNQLISTLPACKSDCEPKAPASLRSLRSSQGIQGIGPILSVEDLVKVCGLAKCESIVCRVTDYAFFLSVIQKAIDHGLPIIVPHSTDFDNKNAPSAIHGHWTTIIGYRFNVGMELVFCADQGIHEFICARRLYRGFYHMENHLPSLHFFKRKKGDEWQLSKNPLPEKEIYKINSLSAMSLKSFKHKLVLVTPPGFDAAKLELNNGSPVIKKRNRL